MRDKYNTIIIGGGMAGLSAGLYLARANKKCKILESKFWGGQTAILNKVENYPAVKSTSGFDIANNLLEQVKTFNVDLSLEQVIKVCKNGSLFEVTTNKNMYVSSNVIIATGAKTGVLGLKNEKKFVGKGISYCATCDGNLFKNKVVAVVGENKHALNDIKYLNNIVKKVYWIIPDKALKSETLNEINDLNVEVLYSSEVTDFIGENKLECVEIYDKAKLKNIKLDVDGVFVCLNRTPDTSWLEVDVKKDKLGYILVNKNCQTNFKGLFACGDIVARNLKQIITACSDGAIAASYIIAKD